VFPGRCGILFACAADAVSVPDSQLRDCRLAPETGFLSGAIPCSYYFDDPPCLDSRYPALTASASVIYWPLLVLPYHRLP
jgi:hypothetical protein